MRTDDILAFSEFPSVLSRGDVGLSSDKMAFFGIMDVQGGCHTIKGDMSFIVE